MSDTLPMPAPLTPPATARRDEPFDRLAEVPGLASAPYGTSLFRRRIRLENLSPTLTIGELEDDCHHFRVELTHDGATIRRADGFFYRGPWSTCASAPGPLRAIAGRPLTERGSDVGRYADARLNCTHLFDLAGLAVTHAARGAASWSSGARATRQYDLLVTDADVATAERRAVLWRNGDLVLDWTLRAHELVSPDEWAGAPLRHKFIPWVEARHDSDLSEAAIALRRIIDIAQARTADLDRFERASEMNGSLLMGRCHTYTPEHFTAAVRLKGSARNWERHGHLLLADMHVRDQCSSSD